MPVLNDLPQPDVRQVILPDPPGLPEAERGWVKVDVSQITVLDYIYTDSEVEDPTATSNAVIQKDFSVNMLTRRIKEWNYTDAKLQPLAITTDNVFKLGPPNVLYLINLIREAAAAAGSLSDAEKKTSSSTSATDGPAVSPA